MSMHRFIVKSGQFAGVKGTVVSVSRFGYGFIVKLDHPTHTSPMFFESHELKWENGEGPFTHYRNAGETEPQFIRRVGGWCRETGLVASWDGGGGWVCKASYNPKAKKLVRESFMAETV